MEPPPGWGEDKLTEFIDEAQKNTYATFQKDTKSYEELSAIDAIFFEAASFLNNYPDLFVPFFVLRSHSCYRAGVRLAMSTQVYETNPVLRSCLEAALYGLLLAKKPELRRIWLDRNKDSQSLATMKREFTIRACFGLLEVEDRRRHGPIKHLYERSIDLGAHPNPLGILGNVDFRSDESGVKVSTHYLTDDKDRITLALRSAAQIGVMALWIFRLAIPERFVIMGLDEQIRELGQGL